MPCSDCNFCKEKKNCKKAKNEKKPSNPFKDFFIVLALTVVVLIIGTIGFYMYHKPDWANAFYNATLVTTTVGSPEMHDTIESMIFTSIYAVFSCLFFVFIIGFFVSSWLSTVKAY